MAVQVIALNGGSSSGKSSTARCPQSLLPSPWPVIGVDDLITAIPPAMLGSPDGIVSSLPMAASPSGQGSPSTGYRLCTGRCCYGARAGAGVILDLVFLERRSGRQTRWRGVLAGLQGPVGWREMRSGRRAQAQRGRTRGDRVPGMAGVTGTGGPSGGDLRYRGGYHCGRCRKTVRGSSRTKLSRDWVEPDARQAAAGNLLIRADNYSGGTGQLRSPSLAAQE